MDEQEIKTGVTEKTPEQIEAERVAAEKAAELEKFEQALKDKAAELSKANSGKNVVPVWYLDPTDPENARPIVGFLMEPNRATKGAIMDTLRQSQSRAESAALQASVMKDHSDPRLTSTLSIYDGVAFAAGREALGLIKIAIDQFKKK